MAQGTRWSIEADFIQACNCDYGCPCEFEAPPTTGFCQGMGAYRISKGNYGDVKLDGLGLGLALHFPAAMHKGNGTGVMFIDERATPQQREALMTITSGKAGGMPFEAFAVIFSKWLDTIYVPFTFQFNGQTASVKAGDKMSVQLEPIRNPVSGEPEKIRIEHESGFIWKSGEAVSAKENRVNVPSMTFSYPSKAGFIAKVKYSNG
jgi:hypothetical protein